MSRKLILRLIACCTLLFTFAAYSSAQSIVSENERLRLDATTDIVISEDTPILSFIEDIESLPNGDFVIASGRDRVVLYVPANASDVRQIGRAGQGPGEYLGPVLARARGYTLLVRDGRIKSR